MTLAERALARQSTVLAACAATLGIGLAFIFIRAPHPWGVEGFDHYHELALGLARGEPFPTLEVPWGYAYFLAAFYRTFGDHPWIPLTAQALLNASVPLLLYHAARHWVDPRTAVLAACLAGVLSFNTVYASTQSSDAVCTVIFLLAVLVLVRATATGRLALYAACGALLGVAPQFRPNLILLPPLAAVYTLKTAPLARPRRAAAAVALVTCAALPLVPWTARNYRLTGMLVPASVHSGVQLWYGTLQVGPYLNSRAYNPRKTFESGVFKYTSLDDVPLEIALRVGCARESPARFVLTYWTLRHADRRAITAAAHNGSATIEVPPPAAPDVVYYRASVDWPDGRSEAVPSDGSALVYFVTRDHLGDQDLGGDFLDVFDVVRAMRHRAWREPMPWEDRLAAAGFGGANLTAMIGALTARFGDAVTSLGPAVRQFRFDDRTATLTLADGSTVTVPRQWHERITDVEFSGGLAESLLPATVRLEVTGSRVGESTPRNICFHEDGIAINQAFYREEPHRLRRYMALAVDNIRRTPLQFAAATLFRVVRLFVVWGTGDPWTTQQFAGGRAVNALATAASLAFVGLFLAGAVATWRRGDPVGLPLLLIAYVPATIAPMLTNMRYTVTVQPLMFVFVAAAIMPAVAGAASPQLHREARSLADTRTRRVL